MSSSSEAADRVVQFFKDYIRHHKGEWAGQPFELAEWQAGIVRTLFGWKRADGTRRFREAYCECPRKQGKTELAAGLGLFLTVADGEPGAEVYSAATKKDQARICHDAATAMVRQSPELGRYVRILRNNLHVQETGSKFEPLGADSNTLDGLNPHGLILDELHAHRDRSLYDVLKTAMGSRRQPLIISITTAGTYQPEAIGHQQHDYAVKVLEGVIEDDSFFAFIAAADEADDWREPSTWWKANPNLDISVKREYLAELAAKAEEQPSFVNAFQRLHLNRWTQQIDRWLPMERWDAIGGPVKERELAGLECWGGLDLATTTDLAALALYFPDEEAPSVLCRFWCPEDGILRRSRNDRVPYDAWARDGWITATPGNVIDFNRIRADILELTQTFRLRELAYDPFEAAQLSVQLADEDGLPMVRFEQGRGNMNAPTRELERLVMAGRLHHGANPVLRWNASNVALKEDGGGRIRPDKKRSAERIDGITALCMAIGCASVKVPEEVSIYATEPMFVI